MSLTDIVKNVANPEKLVEMIRPFIPEKWKNLFAGYGTYIVGTLMILSGVASIMGVPLPWVPLGTEGQWIAGGIGAFTLRRAISNQKEKILDAIKENTEITKTIAAPAAPTVEEVKK
jgi:hypothetical protein